MFSQAKKTQEDTILEWLAQAFKCYHRVEWDYGKADAGKGGFLVDRCIQEPKIFKSTITIIRNGLLKGNEDAKTASLIFDKLYKDGFKNGLAKDAIQDHFNKILPSEIIERLNEGATMADCIQSIRIAEQIRAYSK